MSSLRERVMGLPRIIRSILRLLLFPIGILLWLIDVLLTAPGIALVVFAAAILGGIAGYRILHGSEFEQLLFIEDFYANFSTELISIAITVLVISALAEARGIQADKSRLLIRMASKRNETAVEAVEEARSRGWLHKGLVDGANLRGANLARADFRYASLKRTDLALAILRGADLRGADLAKANLNQAILIGANLSDSVISDEQLSMVYMLSYAIMPAGNFYDGRFNLPGDIRGALQSNVDIDSISEMAEFFSISTDITHDPISQRRMEYYKVSPEEFMQGQRWAGENLDRIRENAPAKHEEWGHELLDDDEHFREVVFDLDNFPEPGVESHEPKIPRDRPDSIAEDHQLILVVLVTYLTVIASIFVLFRRLESIRRRLNVHDK